MTSVTCGLAWVTTADRRAYFQRNGPVDEIWHLDAAVVNLSVPLAPPLPPWSTAVWWGCVCKSSESTFPKSSFPACFIWHLTLWLCCGSSSVLKWPQNILASLPRGPLRSEIQTVKLDGPLCHKQSSCYIKPFCHQGVWLLPLLWKKKNLTRPHTHEYLSMCHKLIYVLLPSL